MAYDLLRVTRIPLMGVNWTNRIWKWLIVVGRMYVIRSACYITAPPEKVEPPPFKA